MSQLTLSDPSYRALNPCCPGVSVWWKPSKKLENTFTLSLHRRKTWLNHWSIPNQSDFYEMEAHYGPH